MKNENFIDLLQKTLALIEKRINILKNPKMVHSSSLNKQHTYTTLQNNDKLKPVFDFDENSPEFKDNEKNYLATKFSNQEMIFTQRMIV